MSKKPIFLKVDWELLEEQKNTLAELAASECISVKQRDHLRGLLCLLDAFQDAAADYLQKYSEMVFRLEEKP
jgi:hypothetical protein